MSAVREGPVIKVSRLVRRVSSRMLRARKQVARSGTMRWRESTAMWTGGRGDDAPWPTLRRRGPQGERAALGDATVSIADANVGRQRAPTLFLRVAEVAEKVYLDARQQQLLQGQLND